MKSIISSGIRRAGQTEKATRRLFPLAANEVNPLHAAKVQNPSIFSEREEEVITVVYGTHAAAPC